MVSKDTTKKITRIFFSFLFVFLVSFFALPINNSYAGLECPAGYDDCDCDGTCEMDVSSDPLNCGKCGNVCAGNYCNNGSCAPVTGGLVPCGRLYDNPDTVWNEQEPCKICHAVPLIDSVIEYLLGIVALITVLSIVIGGVLYVSSAGDASRVTIAKTAVTKSLHGFIFVLTAWIIINVGMVIFGFDDPFGDGSWAKFNCDLITTPINHYCGDGLVDSPNSDGINEVCDPQELKNDFIVRTGLTAEDWVEAIYACDPVTCNLGCVGDPLASQIGEGCYQPNLVDGGLGTACQKGRYICDFNTNTVICQNTFNDSSYRLAGDFCGDVYDYCCDSNSAELSDGLIDGAQFDIVRATIGDLEAGATGFMALPNAGCLGGSYANLSTGLWCSGVPPGGAKAGIGFRCDNVCKNVGKICVGVGLTDPSINSCIYIQHDEGANLKECNNDTSIISMNLPVNQASTNCDAWFGMFYYSTAIKHWSTGYDNYEFYCARESIDNYWHYVNNVPARWNYAITPNTPGVCRPAAGDTCEFHGFDLVETACYCL